MTGGWRALLEGADADAAREAIDAVAEEIGRVEVADRGLYHGQAGVAILHGYRARDGQAGADADAAAALEAATTALGEERAPWLARGFGGVAFALAHLGDLIDAEPETMDELDAAVAQVVDRERWPFDWELMMGLIGLGVYGLERVDAPAGRAIVERALAHLAARATRGIADAGAGAGASAGAGECATATWRGRIREGYIAPEVAAQNPDGTFSLGMGYGVTGAIAFHAAARAAGVASADPSLLAAAVAWLRAQDRPSASIRFPAQVAVGFQDGPTRVNGWCFGDPAVAATLVRAGLAAAEPSWIDHGVEVARHAARWSPAIDTGDLSLCHGLVGRAHLFNRLAQATGAADLADTARALYRRALAARTPGTGIGGFARISRTSATTDEEFAAGLQLGATGVALGLLAAVSDVPPDWDRAMLVALPPRP